MKIIWITFLSAILHCSCVQQTNFDCSNITEKLESNIAFQFKEYMTPNHHGYYFMKTVVDDGSSHTFIVLNTETGDASTSNKIAIHFENLQAESIIKDIEQVVHDFDKEIGVYRHHAMVPLSPDEIQTLANYTISRYEVGESGILLSNAGDDYRNYLKCLMTITSFE